LTEINQMQQEMIQAHNRLSVAAVATKSKFEDRMRATVKELLSYRYALVAKPIEENSEVRESMWHWENAMRIGDAIFGGGSENQMRALMERNRTRPVRVNGYVQKLVDIFPAEYLTDLLRSSLNLTAEELIYRFEANKGEATHSDYGGIPTGIDQSQLRAKATFVKS
jgi:hypothetical protein